MPTANDFNEQVIDEFRANGGKVGGAFEGSSLLLLQTTGAKTGRSRVKPLVYRRDGDRLVVFGTKGGSPTHPEWFYNVRANPRVTVEVGSDRFEADARVALPDERERLWRLQTQDVPVFADYQKKTDRTIPVVILERVA
ncbi:MAG TPA: nitroreductase family deazaflavin-dependent oxidoreductase [Acidimicrobiia bacterium]